MTDLIVKNVSFCESELLAVQDKETGKIYAGINCILRELGFDESQTRYRRDKWIDDKAVSKGVRKFLHPSIGGGQETYSIDIKKLPIALAKIDITPKMENEMPELSEKLEKYQDECADILAAAFIPACRKKSAIEELQEIQRRAILEVNTKVENVERRVDFLEKDIPLYGSESDELSRKVKKRGTEVLGGKNSNAYKDNKLRSEVYADIYNQIKREYGLYDSNGKFVTYKALKRRYFNEALEMVENYKPPKYLEEKVNDYNAQIVIGEERFA